MLSFIKRYWPNLLVIIGGLVLTITKFSNGKTWLGLIWLVLVMVWGVRLYQQYQKDKGHR